MTLNDTFASLSTGLNRIVSAVIHPEQFSESIDGT